MKTKLVPFTLELGRTCEGFDSIRTMYGQCRGGLRVRFIHYDEPTKYLTIQEENCTPELIHIDRAKKVLEIEVEVKTYFYNVFRGQTDRIFVDRYRYVTEERAKAGVVTPNYIMTIEIENKSYEQEI